MRRALPGIVALLLALAGLGLLYLTNTGLLSLGKSYVYRFSAELPTTAQAVAFTDVSIIPMDSERVLPAQTVLVRGGLIEEIGPTGQVQVPRDALDLATERLAQGRAIPEGAQDLFGKPIVPPWVYRLMSGMGWIQAARGYGALKSLRRKPYLARVK